jgi:hypothetical protein
MLHNQNLRHIGILNHEVQERIVRGEITRLARELRTPRGRLETLQGYSVPKMRSPASPRPGRM